MAGVFYPTAFDNTGFYSQINVVMAATEADDVLSATGYLNLVLVTLATTEAPDTMAAIGYLNFAWGTIAVTEAVDSLAGVLFTGIFFYSNSEVIYPKYEFRSVAIVPEKRLAIQPPPPRVQPYPYDLRTIAAPTRRRPS